MIIPLKRIIQELQLQLERDIKVNDLDLSLFSETELTAYIEEFLKKLVNFIVTKNRVGLYNKEGVGLGIAL